jgi:hypothetical protein
MAKASDNVTWTQLAVIVVVMIAVIGGGFAWLHSDASDLRTAMIGLTKEVSTTREDLVKAISGVREQAAVTNTKLDTLIDETRKRR